MFIINKTEVTRCEIFTPSERRLFAFSGAASDPLPSGKSAWKRNFAVVTQGKPGAQKEQGLCVHRGRWAQSRGSPAPQSPTSAPVSRASLELEL